jgi:hypothetical protein
MLHFKQKRTQKQASSVAKKTKNNERRRPKRLGRTGCRSAASIGGATGFSSSATEGRLLQKGKDWKKEIP